VPFDPAIFSIIKGSFGTDGLPMPHVQEIFLIESHVAGTSHIDEVKEIEPDLSVGEFLVLRREPENPHDKLAILILDKSGRKLGYVPQAKNEILARLLDAGKLLFGRLESKEWRGGRYLYAVIRIFMRDM